MAEVKKMEIGEAVIRFLGGLPPDEVSTGQQILLQAVRWFGQSRPLDGLAAAEIEKFCGTIPETDAAAHKKLDVLRRFLEDARGNRWLNTNLAAHVKGRKTKGRAATAANGSREAPEAIVMTREGLEAMKKELASLKEKRPGVIEDIRRAAADKDFRENAPLDAAREQLGHIDGRIKEIEETLKIALVPDGKGASPGAGIGDSVSITCLDTGEKLCYMLVSPREVDASRGRISGFSPLGKAIVGRCAGDVFEIIVPAGKTKYRIDSLKGRNQA